MTVGILTAKNAAGDAAGILHGLCEEAKRRQNVHLFFFCADIQEMADLAFAEELPPVFAHMEALVFLQETAGVAGRAEAVLPCLPAPYEQIPCVGVSGVKTKDGAVYTIKDNCGGETCRVEPDGWLSLAEKVLGHALTLSGRQPVALPEGKNRPLQEHKVEWGHFEHAIRFAAAAHRGQVRKGSSIPYIVHPIETSLIALTLTRDKEVIIAALLHDVIEDTGYGAKEIREAFGERVLSLVQAESENKRKGQDASATWKIRKQEFIDSLERKSREEKIIALSDKLSNMRATYQGYRKNSENFWERFNEKRKEMHAWYYRSVADRLMEFSDTDAWKELDYLIRKVFEGDGEEQNEAAGGF